jgi:hypothetical protein
LARLIPPPSGGQGEDKNPPLKATLQGEQLNQTRSAELSGQE